MPDRLERFSAFSGVLAVLLWVLGAALMGGDHVGIPGGVPEESAEEVAAFFRANEDDIVAGSWLFILGSLSFMWFVGVLRGRLLRSEGGVGTFSAIAFLGGAATAIFAVGMPAGGLVAALGIDHIGTSTAEALNAVEAVFFLAAELSAIVLLAAASVVSLRRGALPRWWAVASIVLAVWLVIGPIGWIGLLAGVPAWTLVTSGLLLYSSPSQ